MLNSRDIDRLRSDVAANCRIFLQRCKAEGLNVLVTGTVRDAEFQEQCFQNGTAATKIPSFHAEHAGLAFDICKNVKGQEYSDKAFFRRCAKIGKEIGFEWGGDWKSFPDMPHFQWSQNGKYTSSMICDRTYPPIMPLYKGEDEMTQEQFDAMMRNYLTRRAEEAASDWAKKNGFGCRGISDGSRPQSFATREEVEQMIVNSNCQ